MAGSDQQHCSIPAPNDEDAYPCPPWFIKQEIAGDNTTVECLCAPQTNDVSYMWPKGILSQRLKLYHMVFMPEKIIALLSVQCFMAGLYFIITIIIFFFANHFSTCTNISSSIFNSYRV